MCVEAMTAGKSLTHGRVNCPMCRLDSRMPEIKFVTVPKAVDKNDLHIKVFLLLQYWYFFTFLDYSLKLFCMCNRVSV